MRTTLPTVFSSTTRQARSTRRAFVAAVAAFGGGLLVTMPAAAYHSTSLGSAFAPLTFTMTRATDGKTVTAADFKGKIVLLYFGYTFCPDVCPTTLLNISNMLKELGPEAKDVRVLFVTVDPNRDTLPVLKQYTEAFASQVIGLRGTPDELASLAKRYRESYSVTPAANGHPYEVTHGAAVYVFDRNGSARLLFSGLALPDVKIAPMTDDLREMIAQTGPGGWWHRLLGML